MGHVASRYVLTTGAYLASAARRFIPYWAGNPAMSATNEAVSEVQLPEDNDAMVPQADSDDSDDQDDDEGDEEKFSGDRLTDKVIRDGTALKEEATALFKAKKFDDAIAKYREGFDAVPADISGYRSGVARDLRVACLNNSAMCQVKIEAWEAAVLTCNEVLEIDSKSVKAWYRQGLAYHKQCNWEAAKSSLRSALDIEPKNKDVVKELESVQKDVMATKKQKGGSNDYSRFDLLEDSDEEEAVKEPEPERRPEPKAKSKPAKKKSSPKPAPKSKPASKPAVDSDDDEGDLLSTKTGSDKKDSKYWWDNRGGANASSTGTLTPQKITSPEQVKATALPAGASQWNSAGTWEEKNMGDWFNSHLTSALTAVTYEHEGLDSVVKSVDGFSGDCNICKRRNKTSWIYDVTFKIKFEIDGKMGTLTIPELSNMDDDDYCIEVKWSSKNRSAAVEAALNVRGRRGAAGLVPRIRDAIAQVSDEFLQQK